MAEAKTSSKRGGLTRGKAILIGILSVVLVAILYIQFGGEGDKPASEQPAIDRRDRRWRCNRRTRTANPVTLASAKSPSNGQPSKAKDAAAAALIDETRWKSPKLETIVAYDPFALPPAFPQPPKAASGKGKDGESDSLPRPRPMMRRNWPRQWKSCTCNWKNSSSAACM